MDRALDVVLWAHVAAGFTGLGAFWVPIFARKGGVSHVRFGRVYAWCAYVVTLSAVLACIWRVAGYRAEGITFSEQPELYGFAFFLGYLGVATFAAVRQSIRAVQRGGSRKSSRPPSIWASPTSRSARASASSHLRWPPGLKPRPSSWR